MRLLRNIICILVPVLLMVNLYAFVFKTSNGGVYEFKGFAYLYKYFDTFPGLTLVTNTITELQKMTTDFKSIEINSFIDVFGAVGKLVSIVGTAFSVPFVFLANLFQMLWWFINIWFIQ